MTLKALTLKETSCISDAGANTGTDRVGHAKNHGQSSGSRGGAYSGVSNDCLIDIGFGFVMGIGGGLPGAAVGVAGNAWKSCTRESGNGNGSDNRGGSISPGQCTR